MENFNMRESQAPLSPIDILRNPLLNKGTAFNREERNLFNLNGLLPYHVSTLEEQVERRYQNFKDQPSPLFKYLFLSQLHNRNEVLFYRLVSQYIDEMMPYVYTPTVGYYSLNYSTLYTEPRGLYLSYPDTDEIERIISNLSFEAIDVMVVTDGERILGLGDLGAGGMAISIGKLCLYTVFGGIHPMRTVPVVLDLGTDNDKLLKDPLYLGWRSPRVRGERYIKFIDRFVESIQRRYPKVLIQWEDFGKEHAQLVLDKYRSQVCSFNDDIQGTAAVVLSALLSAVQVSGSTIHKQRIVVFGGGSAGIGISHRLVGYMVSSGISEEEAYEAIYIVDVDGLVTDFLSSIPPHQKFFSRKRKEVERWKVKNKSRITLEETVTEVKPSVLIGVSAQAGAFGEKIISTMCRYVSRPIIFPLSNPSAKSEANPFDILKWSRGEAIIATGSPFEGGEKIIAQCNNVYIYPGVGLGVVACKAREVTDSMFYEAARILSLHSPLLKEPYAPIFPSFQQLWDISREIALGVMAVAQREGVASQGKGIEEKIVDSMRWVPSYPLYTKPSSL